MVLATQYQDNETIKEIGLQENGTIEKNKEGGDEKL